MTTTVRIDVVTLALFRHLGVDLEGWSDRLRKSSFPTGAGGVDLTPQKMTNLCSEIRPGGPERSELDTYHYIDQGPLPNAPRGMDTARICGGKVQIATGVHYRAPGVGAMQRRDVGILMVHHNLPDSVAQGMIGRTADEIVDHPALKDVPVVGMTTNRSPQPNAFFQDHFAFELDVEWTKAEIDRDLPRHPDA